MCINRLGIGPRAAIAETAVESVGETIAARQQEERIRLQFDAEIGDRGNECTEHYLHKRRRQRHRRHACERGLAGARLSAR
jgi:hypothetical protein